MKKQKHKDITYWKNVIVGNKEIEPSDDEQESNYKIAEYLLLRGKEKTAA